MSSIILPDHMEEANKEKEAEKAAAEQVAKQLPTPCGYKMLVSLPKIEAKYESGLLKADVIVRQDELATVVGFVLRMGPDCYKDKEKFPSGPYCAEGDFVLMRAYAGTRFKLHGVEFRLMNDDSIEGVVMDPRGFSRV